MRSIELDKSMRDIRALEFHDYEPSRFLVISGMTFEMRSYCFTIVLNKQGLKVLGKRWVRTDLDRPAMLQRKGSDLFGVDNDLVVFYVCLAGEGPGEIGSARTARNPRRATGGRQRSSTGSYLGFNVF